MRGWTPTLAGAAALAAMLLGTAGVAAGASAPPDPGIDFRRDIQPIFARRCYACHGPTQQKAGLRLDVKEDVLDGGDSGAVIVPGKSAESELVRRIAATDPKKAMPPGDRLTAPEIARIRAWIDAGAPWPDEPPPRATPRSDHWSFRPVRLPAPPRVRQKSRVANPIDAFVLARLEARGLRPSPLADRVTLIRRVTLDLTGLPPTPEEVDAFLADRRPGAYERLVDRLLDSPHYGERWARWWLDQARYADSNGYTIDSPRQMWMYRDWVIQALNRDLPFDRFTIEQLAGDLLVREKVGARAFAALDPKKLSAEWRDALVATGFHRNTMINEEGGTDPEQFRVEAIFDRVDTTGTVWLGLTIGCARCHSHKYDPITQKEYYRLFAFFNNQDEPTLAFPTEEQERRQRELREAIAAARRELADYDRRAPNGQRDPARARLAARVRELESEEKELARAIASAMVLREREIPRETHLMIRGDFLRKGPRVRPGVPAVLPPLHTGSREPDRLDLARWLVDPRNPLTPRVIVNRIWQVYFGVGLVETENDFGTQGTPPTHPELLDWLASYFVGRPGTGARQPWSLKELHRLIVTSYTYRQSSRHRPELAAIDPQNRLLGRQNRLRLDAEAIRDSALLASGALSRKIGGPSVFPPQPEGTDLFTQVRKNWKPSEGEDRYRRGLYTFHWRSSPYPLFIAFDAPGGTLTCTRRLRSNTPTQALMLANDASLFELAQHLAARMMRDGGALPAARIRYGFRRCLAREPSPAELGRLLLTFHRQLASFRADAAAAAAAAPRERPDGTDTAEAAAWTAVARVLMNLDEFITRE